MVAAASQPAKEGGEAPEVDENQIFLQTVEGKQKQRVYGVGSSVLTYYTSGSRTTGATSSMQELFPSQATFDDAIERFIQSRLDVVCFELYDHQVSDIQRELETLTTWAHSSGMLPPHSSPSPASHIAPSNAEGDLGPDHTTDFADQ